MRRRGHGFRPIFFLGDQKGKRVMGGKNGEDMARWGWGSWDVKSEAEREEVVHGSCPIYFLGDQKGKRVMGGKTEKRRVGGIVKREKARLRFGGGRGG